MATFQDGHENSKYDRQSTPEMRNMFRKYSDELNTHTVYTSKEMDVIKQNIQSLFIANNETAVSMRNLNRRIDEQLGLMDRFLYSAFVRFLNFFGRWYIYGYDGHVYPNRPEFYNVGRVPLITRIVRFLRTSKQKD